MLLVVAVVALVGVLLLALGSYDDGEFKAAPTPGPSPTTDRERVIYSARSAGVTTDVASDEQILALAAAACQARAESGGDVKRERLAFESARTAIGIPPSLDGDLAVGTIGGAAVAYLCRAEPSS